MAKNDTPTEAQLRKRANLLILNNAQEVYDACANVGQMKDNLPRKTLLVIVTNWLRQQGGWD